MRRVHDIQRDLHEFHILGFGQLLWKLQPLWLLNAVQRQRHDKRLLHQLGPSRSSFARGFECTHGDGIPHYQSMVLQYFVSAPSSASAPSPTIRYHLDNNDHERLLNHRLDHRLADNHRLLNTVDNHACLFYADLQHIVND